MFAGELEFTDFFWNCARCKSCDILVICVLGGNCLVKLDEGSGRRRYRRDKANGEILSLVARVRLI